MQVVASFSSYGDAQRAVDFLDDRRFPLDEVALVASELRVAQRITPGMGYAYAAIDAAVPGAAIGALLGVVLGELSMIAMPMAWLVLALSGVAIGATGGSLIAVVRHVVSPDRRARQSVRLRADRYDLVADPGAADAARRLLGEFARRSRTV